MFTKSTFDMIQAGKPIYFCGALTPIVSIETRGFGTDVQRFARIRDRWSNDMIDISFGEILVEWSSGKLKVDMVAFEARSHGMTKEDYESLWAAEGMGQMRHSYVTDPEAYAMICSCTGDYDWLPGGRERWAEYKKKSFYYAD
jgi:hypothetical protein